MKEIGHMVQPQKEATIRLKALKNLIVGCLHYVPPLKLIIEPTGNEGANPPHVTLSMLQVTKGDQYSSLTVGTLPRGSSSFRGYNNGQRPPTCITLQIFSPLLNQCAKLSTKPVPEVNITSRPCQCGSRYSSQDIHRV